MKVYLTTGDRLLLKGAVILLLIAGLGLILSSGVVLFEDGSIQFFDIPGLGLCLIQAMGC